LRANRLLVLLLFFFLVVFCLEAAPALAVQATNIAVSKVTPNTAIVVVKTDVASDVVIDYGNSPGVYTAQRSGSGLGRHEILLDGLAPSTTVYYRVTMSDSANPADTLTLAESSFHTTRAAGEPFSFGVVGDNRPSPVSPITQPAVLGTIIGQMAGENLDLVLHSGDIVESHLEDTPALSEEKYNAFFSVTRLLTASTPMYTAVGNHEGIQFATNRSGYEDNFTLPVNNGASAATEGEEYYSFDNGDTHFIVLCTEMPGDQALIIGDQMTWLQQDLAAAAGARWKVIILHRPFFSGTHLDPWLNPNSLAGQANKAALLSLFQQYGVDVVFEGHDHFYLRHVDNGIQYIISGGGGAHLYSLPAFGPGDIFGASVNHHVRVDETADSLKVTAIDSSGSTLESFTLGTPSLSLAPTAVYWGSLFDYLSGTLSVDYALTNTGFGDVDTLDVVYLSASNGVAPITTVPVHLGSLPVGQSAPVTLEYNIPAGVSRFSATTYVTCTDLSGNSYAFPGPAPAA